MIPRTEKELLEECLNQFTHLEEMGVDKLSTTESLRREIQQRLNLNNDSAVAADLRMRSGSAAVEV